MAALLTAGLGVAEVRAQVPYDASWYDGDAPYVKISVTQDGLYRVTGASLQAAGVPLDAVDPATLRLLKKGREIPLDVRDANGDGTLSSDESFAFVGKRNRGTDEAWAYNGQPSRQSSTHRSLYTDTLTYWLTWGGGDGQRYTPAASEGSSATVVRTTRDTTHREQDRTYHYGNSDETGNPLFTLGEGYYWHAMSASDTRRYTLSLPRAATSEAEDLVFTVRMVGRTGYDGLGNSCHRAVLEVDFGSGFEAVGETQWINYELGTLRAEVPQQRISGSALEVRVRTRDEGFDELEDPSTSYAECPADAPNGIYVDFVEAAYTRHLAPGSDGQQRFAAHTPGASTTYALSGYPEGTEVTVLDPATQRRFTVPVAGDGTASFTDAAAPETRYWATAGGYASPAALTYQPAGSRPDWTASANDAEYVVLTTEMMRASAQELAAYRRANDGYTTAVVTVEEVFDQFDYGRATPVAIRRFIHHTQSAWSRPTRFVTFWGDATYPIRTATAQPDAPWNVPAFGFAPSDAWYAMQYDGPDDWSEVMALGRVPVRTAAQAATFLDKLEGYESARLGDWQKRYLALSGGTRPAQQRRLERYNTTWADSAASPPTGMDTLYFSKSSSDALDASFQDSLDAAFERGAGWLNYFGHSAAQTWEIVTEAPAQFENAGRLPFVVSLGCQTGAFAGGRYSEKPAPSFGEQLVLGMNPDAPRGAGSRNGAIAHFGTSYFGVIGTSARLNDGLINSVFKDTVRLAGAAVQQAKARAASSGYVGATLREHLLQYNLLGDAATRLALPERPNFHLEPPQLTTRPLAPVPSDSLRLTARIKNQGLVPADSVEVLLSHRPPPPGERLTERRRVAPFRLKATVSLSTFLTEDMVGPNQFRVEADPSNRIAEAREDDNAAQQEAVVSASGLRLVAPRERGTVPGADPVFRLNLSSPQAETVRLQLAADSAFADVRAQETLEATGPLVKWTPRTTLEANRTYHWRARLASAGAEQGWRTGSFTALPEPNAGGWLQQDAQFNASTQQRLKRTGGQWAFGTYETAIQAYSSRGGGSIQYGFVLGGGVANYNYIALGIGVLILDGQSGAVKASTSFCPSNVSDRWLDLGGGRMVCDGDEGTEAIARLQNLLRTTLDEGDHLFVRTRNLVLPGRAPLPEEVQTAFACLGEADCSPDVPRYSQAADTLTYGDLWIMQARKGFPDQTHEQVEPAGSDENETTYRVRLPFLRPQGQTTSPVIGPARDWSTLTWDVNFENAADRVRFDVLDADSSVVLRQTTASTGTAPARLDLSGLNPRAHPYLRLRATLVDSTERTPPQLQRWYLSYTPTAELALDQTSLELVPSDTLDEGQPATARAPVVNLTGVASRPVHVHFSVTDSSNQTRPLAADTLATLGPDEQRVAEGRFSTAPLAGENVLTIRAQQQREASGTTPVPEALTFNNSLVKSFFVRSDRTAPEVRVTVNGRALPSDPEPAGNLQDPALPFVSLTPTFEVTLDDDSEYLALEDTSLIDVRFGIAPDLERVSFASEQLKFIPADESGDPARALFSPNLRTSARDTVYTLQVEVADARGNEPEMTYQAHVRVKAEMAVRDLYPYPNPMSTHTDLMFRLEGGRPADIEELRLRIYTLSGQLIREFTRTGADLRTDWNRIRWNGRDADGDRVATGVYLYKVHVEGEGDLDVNDGNVEKIAVIR